MKIIPIVIMIAFLTFGHLFILNMIEDAFNFSFGFSNFLFSLLVPILQGLIGFLGFKISEGLYCIIYKVFAIYYGFALYLLLDCLLYFCLSIFIAVPYILSFLLMFIIPVILCIYGMVNAETINIDKINLKCPGFKRKVTICHLSDIHLGAIHQKSMIQKIVTKIEELSPDIVVITGDLADGSLRVKSDWMSPFDYLTIPVLYITGNHEQLHGKAPMLTAVKGTKIQYIGNTTYEFNGINFIGIDYEFNLKKKLRELGFPKMSGGKEAVVPNVLLYHIPLINPKELEEFDIFLFLAGHTHGGQLFPFQIPVYFANACFGGLYSWNNHHIYVSTGVGNALPPMRVGSKSVIGMITIEG